MSRPRLAVAAAAVLLAVISMGAAPVRTSYDLAIIGGRVMDPETGADRIANVGIRDGTIVAITTDALAGARVIDAKGLVVAPGFIDIHSHAQYPYGYDQQARDGVTTLLELEEGVWPVKPFYSVREAARASILEPASGFKAFV